MKPAEIDARRSREASFGFLLQLLARRMDGLMKQRLDDIGLSIKAFANIRLLSEKDGVSQRELGRLLEFPGYHTSRSIDELIADGLVERQPDPQSRRSVKIFLTAKGRRIAKKLPEIIESVNSEFLADLTPAEQRSALNLLQKIAKIPASGEP